MRRIRTTILSAVCALALVACGGDADDATTDALPDERDGAKAAPTPSDSGECTGTDLTLTNLGTGESIEATSTAAVSLVGGAAYTVYGADFDLDADAIDLVTNPEVPDDGNLVTLAVTIFNAEEDPEPLEAGTEIEYTRDFGVLTFTVVHTAGETQYGNSTDAAGSLTVTGVGETFCAEVGYADAEKELTGTIEATVKSLS